MAKVAQSLGISQAEQAIKKKLLMIYQFFKKKSAWI